MADNTTVPWRQGSRYGIHVYAQDVPVATFHTSMDARRAVLAHNHDLQRRHDDQDDATVIDRLTVRADKCVEELAVHKKALNERREHELDLIADMEALAASLAQWKAKYTEAESARVRLAEMVEDLSDTPVMAPRVGSGQRLTDLVEVQRVEIVQLRAESEKLRSEMQLVRDTTEATIQNLRNEVSRLGAAKEALSEQVEEMREVKVRPAASLDAMAQAIRLAFYAGVLPGVPWDTLPPMEKRVWLDMAMASRST